MRVLWIALLCVVLTLPMMAIAQTETTVKETPAGGQMPGMMMGQGGMGQGMGGGMGMRAGGGAMQMKGMVQEMMGYLKLCEEVKTSPADMEKINKWMARSADMKTTQGMAGMVMRETNMKDSAAMLADVLTMAKGCKGLKEDPAKVATIDTMISKAKAIAEGKNPKAAGAMGEAKEAMKEMKGMKEEAREEAKGAMEEAKEEAKGAAEEAEEEAKEAAPGDPQAMGRQMFMQNATMQKLVPETATI